jgi:hypothetical protein
MRLSMRQTVVIALVGAVVVLPSDVRALATFTDVGLTAADIQDTVDAYRAALGDPNNANAPGPLSAGRREINWDGGGPPVINGTAPVTPFTVFQNTRGATFTTPGTGLTQAAATGGLLSLDLINPTYAGLFAPFSPNRLFTPIGSNVTEGFFSIPGTGGTLTAGVSGFGAVFSDVDLLGPTTIEYFDAIGGSIGVFDVPALPGNQTFSFLGIVLGPAEGVISRVSITTGTEALGPDESATVDLAVMDDFFYGEPQAIQAIPYPPSVLLVAIGLIAVSRLGRKLRPRRD